MFLRIILNIIKPSNEQLRSNVNGRFICFKIWLYKLLLRRLLKTYLHYAISDSIIINNGDIKIVNEFRDLEFENELIRNKIEFKSELVSHLMPISLRKSKTVRNFSFFKFKNLLSLYINDNELFIKHDEALSIDGTIMGKLQCSPNKGCIFQSIITIMQQQNSIEYLNNKIYQQAKLTFGKKSTNQRQRKIVTSSNIFEREREASITLNALKVDKTEIIYDNQPKAIEKKGFDIDTSF